jgi:hypothetical protein
MSLEFLADQPPPPLDVTVKSQVVQTVRRMPQDCEDHVQYNMIIDEPCLIVFFCDGVPVNDEDLLKVHGGPQESVY